MMAAQTKLLQQLVQGQQAIHQLLQQQHHQWRYPELNEEIKETRDVYSGSLMPLARLPMVLKYPQIKCRTLKDDTCDVDLSAWEITCTEFIPRGRRQTSSTTNASIVIRARTCSPVREKMDHARCTTPKKSLVGMPIRTSLGNK
jgi:hypothetical protein